MVRPKTRLEPRPYQSAAFDRLDRRVRSRLAPAVAPISRACADLAAAEVPADDRPRPPRKDLPGGLRPVVAPSLLAADPANLADAARAALSAGATWLHVDVFDGSKACGGALSNMGPGTVSALRAALGPDAFLDVHAGVRHLDVEAYRDASQLTFQFEAVDEPVAACKQIRALGLRAGVCVAPSTPAHALDPLLDAGLVDLVDVLFVEPGRGGQDFNEDCLEKLRHVRARAPGVDLMADGGIHETTAYLAAAGQRPVAGVLRDRGRRPRRPPGGTSRAHMSACGYCGGDASGEGDFLPCCGKPICQPCFLSSHSVPGPACRLCSAVVPHSADDLFEAYERLAVAGHEQAARRGLLLSSMLLAKARRDGDDEAVRSLQQTDLCDYFGKMDLDRMEGRSSYDVESLKKFRDARVREKATSQACPKRTITTKAIAEGLEEMSATSQACVVCEKAGRLKVCQGCKCVSYCSAECQKADWPAHKKSCKMLKSARTLKKTDGQHKLETGNHAKSAKYYEMGFALEPDDVCHAFMNYGLALRGLGRHAEAKPFLERAFALDKDDGPACFNLAQYLEEKEQDTTRSWPLYRRATEVAPTKTHAQAWFGLGMTSDQLGKIDEAIVAYKRCLVLAPMGPQPARNNIIILLSKAAANAGDNARFDDAFRYLDDAERVVAEGLRLNPNDATMAVFRDKRAPPRHAPPPQGRAARES
ncbi:ribulose-phosphate 3-epimerase [Aureococcus anophagefferens]|nr:ribulose-phosphate 3-epimerase [Aureococcus anophagefferens]